MLDTPTHLMRTQPPELTTSSRVDPGQNINQRAQRAKGEALLSAKRSVGQSRIDRLRQQGCCKLRLPDRSTSNAPLEAVMINSSGGLTGGDRLAWRFEAADETAITVTTQACERAYRSNAGTGRVAVDLSLGAHSSLNWLPQETILFDGSALERTVSVNMAATARLLLVEPIVLGREAMGECLTRFHFRDRWTIRREDNLIHAEALALSKGPPRDQSAVTVDPLIGAQTLAGHLAMATVLLVSQDADHHIEPLRSILTSSEESGDLQNGAASTWNGKLLARLVANDAYSLRRTLIPILELLNDGANMPKAWSL
ncbi:MAG: urease accessory protein UreD [Pseudomonadota bacterium]